MRHYGAANRFSICGLTHSACSPLAIKSIRESTFAPIQPWDAEVYTSAATQKASVRVIELWAEYLKECNILIGKRSSVSRVIPFGIPTDKLTRTDSSSTQGFGLRKRLGIPADDFLGLVVADVNPTSPTELIPVFQAFEKAQVSLPTRRLSILLAAPNMDRDSKRKVDWIRHLFCPSVAFFVIPAPNNQLPNEAWHAADCFVSLSEDFTGNTGPLIASGMAASLPPIVVDCNGNRELVEDGKTGFLIPTMSAGPGAGLEFSNRMARSEITTSNYHRIVGNAIAAHVGQCALRISELATNQDLTRRMGESAHIRVAREYSWDVVVKQYQTLWGELQDIRIAAQVSGQASPSAKVDHPDYPDLLSLCRDGFTSVLHAETRASLGAVDPDQLLRRLYSHLSEVLPDNKLLPESTMSALIKTLSNGPISVAEIARIVDEEDSPSFRRTLILLYKYSAISLLPSGLSSDGN